MKKFHQISGFVAVPVMAFSALVGLGLLSVAIYKNSDGLSFNKGNLLAQTQYPPEYYDCGGGAYFDSNKQTFSFPSAGATLNQGSTYNIAWSGADPISFTLRLVNGSNVVVGNVSSLVTGSQHSVSWTVPTNIPVGSDYKISIYVKKCSSGTFGSLSKGYIYYSDSFSIAAPAAVPSITISSNPPADSSGNITIEKGSQIVITGTPSNLSGTMLTDYSRAFWFDPIFNASCGNTEWVMTCTANNIGTSNFYIDLYKDSQTYKSNVIKVTVVAPTPSLEAPAPSIKVLSPNGGESYKAYDSIPVKLSLSTQWPNAHSLILYLVNQNKTIKKEMFKLTTTGTSLNFSTGTYDTGTYPIPPDISSASNYSMLAEISSSDGKLIASDQSDAPFTITAPTPTASIKVLSPNGGENWIIGETKNITWSGTETDVQIFLVPYPYDTEKTTPSTDITTSVGQHEKQMFSWTVPSIIKSGQYTMRVYCSAGCGGPNTADNSDAPFTITAPTTAPSLKISVSTEPSARTIMAGSNQVEFARYILDATASGEDLIIPYLPVSYGVSGTGNYTDLTSCKLYTIKGGSSPLTTGVYVINPAGSNPTFTFDRKLTILKGVTEELSLKCDIKSTATGSYQWGYSGKFPILVTGLTSGRVATITEISNPGQAMNAISGGALSVSLDSVSPYKIASPGQTVVLAQLRFSATGENIAVKQVALQLSNPELNTPTDLVGQAVTLWDGATQVGQAVFASGDNAISSAITNFVAPAGGAKVLTVKGIISGISYAGPLTKSGDLLKVDYDGDNPAYYKAITGTYGVGVASGQTIDPVGGDTNSTGVRIMKAYPSLEKISLNSSERTLVAGDFRTLYKFKVTANHGDVSIAKFIFKHSSSPKLDISKFGLYAFTDSGYSSTDGGFSGSNNPGGLLSSGNKFYGTPERGDVIIIYPNTSDCSNKWLGSNLCGENTFIRIPNGETRWFELRASIGSLGSQQSLTVQLEGDAAYPVNGMQTSAAFDSGDNNDFIWSPNSIKTSLLNDSDWTNGYGVPGLPSDNLSAQTLTASGSALPPAPSGDQATIDALQAQITALLEQIKSLQKQLQTQLAPVSSSSYTPSSVIPATSVTGAPGGLMETFSHTWTRDLYYGLMNDSDVQALQNALIKEGTYKGPVTGNFLELTRQGVIKFQKKYNFTNIPDTGYVGSYTRQALNEIYSRK